MPAFYLTDKYITMNKQNLDQALAALADALKSDDPDAFDTNPKTFVKKIPHRSLTGDHINGGKIINFSSNGIVDQATKTQVTITDEGLVAPFVKIGTVRENLAVEGTVSAHTIKADILDVKEIKADIKIENDSPLRFAGDNIYGKGILWEGIGYTKQFVFAAGPDKFFSSEHIDLGKGRYYSVNNQKVIDDKEIGETVETSYLRQVGRLRGLLVDGNVVINDYVFFNGTTDRLGLGTDAPNATLSIAEHGVEVIAGTRDFTRGMIGTFASSAFDIVTDNTPRISVAPSGDVQIGNKTSLPIQVGIHGNLGINVNSPDPRAQLHVAGAIKFNDKIHLSGDEPPKHGVFNKGDIVWNNNPQMGRPVGWVCLGGGTPGAWAGFGQVI